MSRTYRSQFSRLLHQRLDLEPYPEWEEAFFVLKKLIFKQAFWAFLQRFLHNLTPIFITLCLLGASCGKSNFAFFIAPKKAFWSFLQLFPTIYYRFSSGRFLGPFRVWEDLLFGGIFKFLFFCLKKCFLKIAIWVECFRLLDIFDDLLDLGPGSSGVKSRASGELPPAISVMCHSSSSLPGGEP